MSSKSLALVLPTSVVITVGTMAFLMLRPENIGSAVSGLLGSMIGTMVGVGLVLDYERRKASAQRLESRRERKQRRLARNRRIKSMLREELVHNGNAVLHLITAVEKSPQARLDTWGWARSVADSFEVRAFRSFEATTRTPKERVSDEPIDLCYRSLIRIGNHVRRAEKAHSFYLGFSADQDSADDELEQVRLGAEIVRTQIGEALAILPADLIHG